MASIHSLWVSLSSLTLPPFHSLSSPWHLSLALALALPISAWFLASFFLLPKLHNYPPAVPALPILGNLLQLKNKKPFKTFTEWADKYGPIFTLQLGAETMVIISSPAIAKEAMITKYASVSTRKMPTALELLTAQKTMVAMSDYGEEHRMLKRLIVNHLLSPIPQKANRSLREIVYSEIINDVYAEAGEAKKKGMEGEIDIRECVKRALLPFSMHQVIGRRPEQVFVEEWGRNVGREEMLKVMVSDPLETVVKVDWRNFFPYLRWVPNKALEDKVKAVRSNADAIVGALIREQKLLFAAEGKKPESYLDTLLADATHLTEKQLIMSTWEPIIETVDTTLVTIEWAMYEIAKRHSVQEKLWEEIRDVAGSRPVTEDDLPKLYYLTAVVKETLRFHAPIPLLPARHVDEDIQLGGYNIRKGWQIMINVYGINYAKETWSNPEEWDPERLLGDEDLDMGFKDQRILTFGTGKRMCAGIAQAMTIISMSLALMVQHFQWRLTAEEQAKSEVDMETLTSHKLYPVRAIPIPRFPSSAPS